MNHFCQPCVGEVRTQHVALPAIAKSLELNQ